MPKERRTTSRTHKDQRKREMFSQATSASPLVNGLIVSRFGQQADVRDDEGREFRCHLRKHLSGAAVGDKVEWQAESESLSVVVNILPRRNELTRPNPYEGIKCVAANIDHILVLIAPVPALSEALLDRYLVASECTAIPATIVINKWDLLDQDARELIRERMAIYQQLQYSVFFISTKTGEGMDTLTGHISDGTSVVIGQSGVGKSSLVNALIPAAQAAVGDISQGSALGQHTTTASRLFWLPHGGALIDSPGVREFGLWHYSPEQIAGGFRELNVLAQQCKFRNCKHQSEPGCAVRAGVGENKMTAARFDSFLALMASEGQ